MAQNPPQDTSPNLPLTLVELLFDKLASPARARARLLTALMEVQNVERGSLWVRRNGQFVCEEAVGPESGKVRGVAISEKSRSIVGTAISEGKTIVAETAGDARHFKEIDRYLDVKNTLILCFPLRLRDGTVYGAVQILDTSAEGDRMNLDPQYLQLLEGLVAIGGIALGVSLEMADQQRENVQLRKMLEQTRAAPAIIGDSAALQRALDLARLYSESEFPVLITGESGTGKELFAREIHRLGPRGEAAFLAINCSAIPGTLLESELFGYRKGAFTGADSHKDGLFTAADGGTLFLDEIGDMPADLQAKMLRVLQSGEIQPLGDTKVKKVDVRVIAATNKDLYQSVSAEEFRVDLFYRLNVLPLELPPLRERDGDVWLLLSHFLDRYGEEAGRAGARMQPLVRDQLVGYPWPGNIREMENLVKYLVTVARGAEIGMEDLPPPYNVTHVPTAPAGTGETHTMVGDGGIHRVGTVPAMTWEEMERAYVLALLEEKRWNIAAAARVAGVKRSTFTSRMRRLGISKSR